MKPTIEARYKKISGSRGRASVHVELDEGEQKNGFTVSNILTEVRNGVLVIKMPLVRIGGSPHAAITFQGALKRGIYEAIKAAAGIE